MLDGVFRPRDHAVIFKLDENRLEDVEDRDPIVVHDEALDSLQRLSDLLDEEWVPSRISEL